MPFSTKGRSGEKTAWARTKTGPSDGPQRRNMKLQIEWPDGVPVDQFSLDFVQKMANRMVQGYAKYGPIERVRRDVDRIKSLQQRLDKYRETGNSEWLVDAGNMAMIQFILDGPENFHATPTEESPGLAKHNGGQRHGKDTVEGSTFYRRLGD